MRAQAKGREAFDRFYEIQINESELARYIGAKLKERAKEVDDYAMIKFDIDFEKINYSNFDFPFNCRHIFRIQVHMKQMRLNQGFLWETLQTEIDNNVADMVFEFGSDLDILTDNIFTNIKKEMERVKCR